jgi:uncharacterized protein (DUF1800 family)
MFRARLLAIGFAGCLFASASLSAPGAKLNLWVKPSTVPAGESAALTWSTRNVVSCMASGGWSGGKATSGSESTGALADTATYTLDCVGDGGSISRSVTVTVTAPPAPTLVLTASPTSVLTGGASTLSWSSTNATSCTASGGWSGGKATSGTESTGPLSAATTFVLTCVGDGGSAVQSTTVNVTEPPPPAPTLTLTADPLSIEVGQSSMLHWNASDATSCTARDGWSGDRPTSGSQSTGELNGTTSFTLECVGPGGSVWETVTVTVVPATGAISRADAFRFLNQASFGPTETSVAALTALGSAAVAYGRWIDAQLSTPASLELPATQVALARDPNNPPQASKFRRSQWFKNAIDGPDQLRLRVAFALSEILVVSEYGPLYRIPLAVASFNDTIVQHAFGNYRDLIEAVTLHPAMGIYLSMLGNQKPDLALNIRSDENYARELMQLFSIGLVQLNLDGTEVLDDDGNAVPTYDQQVVENLARVFTGWTYAGAASFQQAKRTLENQVIPMVAYPEQHDTDKKSLLVYPGATKTDLPAGQSPDQDLADALDNVFNHPNVGPFISKQLIQRLVTSNPTPSYVARVAATFDDDGSGQRGNLAAVVKAILLDPEARRSPGTDIDGKLKEPLLRMVQFLRAYEARAASGEYRFDSIDDITGQGPLLSQSVFNFFSPSYAPSGEISDRGLVAPELEIVTEHRVTTFSNYLYDQVFRYTTSNNVVNKDAVVIDLSDEVLMAGDPGALVNHIDAKLLGGTMSEGLRTEATAAASRIAVSKPADRVREALFLIATSPEFAVLR